MDANEAKATETDLSEKYIKQTNYENHMKIKEEQVEDRNVEKAFQMIPELPKSFEIKTENVNNGMEDYLALDNYINIMPSCETTSNEGDKSEYVNNDMEDYLALDNYINIMPSCETTSNEGHKSPRVDTFDLKEHESAKSKTEIEEAGSAKSISINIPPSNNIYDGHREKKKHTIHKKITLQNMPLSQNSKLKDKDEEQNTFPMWRLKRIAEPNIYNNEEETGIDAIGVPICEHAELTEISKGRLIKSNSLPDMYDRVVETGINIAHSICAQPELTEISKGRLVKSNSMTSLPCIYESMAETGINITDHSPSDQPELPETANAEVIRSKRRSKLKLTGAFLTAMVMMLAGAGLCYIVYYFTPSNTDNTKVDVHVTATDEGHVTATDDDYDDICFDFRANCNTSLIENGITGKKYIKLSLFTYFEINLRINNCENS